MRAALALFVLLTACQPDPSAEPDPITPREQWTVEQAQQWFDTQAWPVGFNYAPRTAVNQLEMWQPETWDPDTIDEELGWAADLGFNTARVFLHDLLWQDDPEGLLERMDSYLAIADSHGIRTMFVIFDGVWNPVAQSGPQPEPVPGVHNSQWVQSPGSAILGDVSRHAELQGYVQGVIERFRDDERVLVWDLFNEADNPNLLSHRDIELPLVEKSERALDLLRATTDWARAVDPQQPLTAGAYLGPWGSPDNLSDLNEFFLNESDINSFHSYEDAATVADQIADLRAYGRPLLCTEYMARPQGSTFQAILPLFEQEHVGAWHWGLVNGRIQTIYPWSSWTTPAVGEPDPWFHDVLRGDGSPYDESEAGFLRDLLL